MGSDTLRSVKKYFNRAERYLASGDIDDVLEAYKEAIHLEPDDTVSRFAPGMIWERKCRHDMAIQDLNESIRLDPANANARHMRGRAWGGRIRTCDHGIKTRCLTAWLRPTSAEA